MAQFLRLSRYILSILSIIILFCFTALITPKKYFVIPTHPLLNLIGGLFSLRSVVASLAVILFIFLPPIIGLIFLKGQGDPFSTKEVVEIYSSTGTIIGCILFIPLFFQQQIYACWLSEVSKTIQEGNYDYQIALKFALNGGEFFLSLVGCGILIWHSRNTILDVLKASRQRKRNS